jgi:hypothetical protein
LLVPKASSTSIQFALLPLFDYDLDEETLGKLKKKTAVTDKGIPVLAKGISFHGVHELFGLSPHRIGKAHFLAGMSKEYHRYFKFAFVRNPWDRLVSCYMSKIVMGGPGLKMRNYGDISLSRDMTFKEFAEAVCRIPDEESDPHFRSQHIVICDDSPGKGILADFVGRFENLEEDFGIVAKRLGLEINLPETVSSADLKGLRSYRDFYDERLAEIVGERYRDDAKVFGYSF